MLFRSHWRGDAPPVTRIELTEVTSSDALIYSFEVGTLSILSTDPFDSASVNIRADMETWSYPTARMHYLGFDGTRAPLNQADVRRAISQALDRALITNTTFNGYADPVLLPVPPQSSFKTDPVEAGYGFDLQKTTELLGNLGFADEDHDGVLEYPASLGGGRSSGGARIPFAAELLVCSENITACAAAAQIADMLGQQGLPVTLKRLPYDSYLRALEAGEFDLYYGVAQLSGDFDPAVFLQDGALWYGAQYDPQLDTLCGELQNTPDSASALQRRRVYQAFLENTVISPLLFTQRQLISHRGRLTDPSPIDTNLFYHWEDWGIRFQD